MNEVDGVLVVNYYEGPAAVHKSIYEISIQEEGYLLGLGGEKSTTVYIDLRQVKSFYWTPYEEDEPVTEVTK